MSQPKEYILAENTYDGVNFDLRGLKYFLRYPVVSEVETIQELSEGIDDAEELRKTDPEAYKAKSHDLENFLYGLITPVGHDMPIKEALQDVNVRIYRNFNTMVKTELSLQA
jgi:hypothetical protein